MKKITFSTSGLVLAVVSFILLSAKSGTFLINATYLGGGCALLIRSFSPPLNFGRGFATWVGGGLAAGVPVGIWGLIVSINGDLSGFAGLAFSESLVLFIMGLPAYFLLRKGFKPIQLTNEDIAAIELRKASKLEARGELIEAQNIYKKIVSSFGETTVAKDAESCLTALDKQIKAINQTD